MREFIVTPETEGARLMKYLNRLLPLAADGFLYRMLRKKNITLNGKKAGGKEVLSAGDTIAVFFSDETFDRFHGQERTQSGQKIPEKLPFSILYEDDSILLLNKPKGLLAQGAKPGDESVASALQQMLPGDPSGVFRPAPANRLDRNTSGIMAAGKTLAGTQLLTELIRERKIQKQYLTLVEGHIDKAGSVKGFLVKDEKRNISRIDTRGETGKTFSMRYRPLETAGGCTLLEVTLITGRSHQIRAYFADSGNPVWGDPKYGAGRAGGQFLHAWKMSFPEDDRLGGLSGVSIAAPLPESLRSTLTRLGFAFTEDGR